MEIVPEKVIHTGKPQDNKNQVTSETTKPTSEKIKSNVPAVVKEKSFSGAKRWGLAVVVLVGIGASLYYFRPQLENRFDFAKTYYQKWDDYVTEQSIVEPEPVSNPIETPPPHPSSFLSMTNNISASPQNGIPTLSINGEIRNSSGSAIDLPPVNVDIKNTAGEVVFNTIHTLELGQVAAGGVLQFTIAVPNYPSDSSLVDLSLMWGDAP